MRGNDFAAVSTDEVPSVDPEEVDVAPREGRSTDLSTASIPLIMALAFVVSAVTAAVSASGVYWMLRLSNQESYSTMQADIRSIREGLASQAEIDKANKRADDAERDSQRQSYESTKQAVDSLRGTVQLLQLQVTELVKQRRP